jgi:hypothetical protein
MFASLTMAVLLSGAADTLEIKPTFKAGEVYYSTTVNNMEQTVSVAGMDMNQKMKQTTTMKYEVKEVTATEVVVKMTYLDSQIDAEGIPGVAEQAEKMKGIVLTATINLSKRVVTKLDGYEEFLDKASGDNDMTKKLLKSSMSKETMKKSFSEVVSWMPTKAVAVGDTWKQDDTMPLGPLGNMKLDTKHKLVKFDTKTAEVSFDSDLTYQAPDGEVEGLPFKISKGDLSSEKFSGKRTVDLKTGRILDSTTTGIISGSLTIAVAGQELPLSLKQKLTVTSKITDRNPLDEK